MMHMQSQFVFVNLFECLCRAHLIMTANETGDDELDY
jgi:hypothetical protein